MGVSTVLHKGGKKLEGLVYPDILAFSSVIKGWWNSLPIFWKGCSVPSYSGLCVKFLKSPYQKELMHSPQCF